MDVADRQHVHRVVEVDPFAADQRADDLARPLEHLLFQVVLAHAADAGQLVEKRRHLAQDACRDLHPQHLVQAEQEGYQDERLDHVAHQLADQHTGHSSAP